MGNTYTTNIWITYSHSYTNYFALSSMDRNSGGGANSITLERTLAGFRIGVTAYTAQCRVAWSDWQAIGY